MSHNHQIRSGRLGDANRIAVLATQVWLHTYAVDGINEVTAQYILSELTPEKYLQALNDSSTHFLLVERDKNLIGFARIQFDTPCPTGVSSTVELQTLYVQEHFIGHGVGKALLHAAEAKAYEKSESALWLTVNVTNARAIDFYARQGYTKVGTEYFSLGDEHYENHVFVGQNRQ